MVLHQGRPQLPWGSRLLDRQPFPANEESGCALLGVFAPRGVLDWVSVIPVFDRHYSGFISAGGMPQIARHWPSQIRWNPVPETGACGNMVQSVMLGIGVYWSGGFILNNGGNEPSSLAVFES